MLAISGKKCTTGSWGTRSLSFPCLALDNIESHVFASCCFASLAAKMISHAALVGEVALLKFFSIIFLGATSPLVGQSTFNWFDPIHLYMPIAALQGHNMYIFFELLFYWPVVFLFMTHEQLYTLRSSDSEEVYRSLLFSLQVWTIFQLASPILVTAVASQQRKMMVTA